MKIKNILVRLAALAVLTTGAAPLSAQSGDVILPALQQEVQRNLQELRIENLRPPFYISYAIADLRLLDIGASMGALVNLSDIPVRSYFPFVLVGDYQRNNSNFWEHNVFSFNLPGVPIEDDKTGIETNVWATLDAYYKNAAEKFESKQSIIKQQNLPEEEANLPDFEKREPSTLMLDKVEVMADRKYWEEYAKKASEVARKYPEIISSKVNVHVKGGDVYYYDTEGSSYRIPAPYYALNFTLYTRTEDGQDLYDDMTVDGVSFEQLPDLQTYTAQCEQFIRDFLALRNAPMIDDAYSGPVMFEEMALGEIFKTNFFGSQALIAYRKPVGSGGRTPYNLDMMMGKKVISRSLTIESMSGTKEYNGTELAGYFPIDAQAVAPAGRMTLVEKGVLRNMLNGRIPTTKVKNSNGHMRFNIHSRMASVSPGVVRLSSEDACSADELRKRLIAAAKEEDLDYGYIVRRMKNNSVVSIYRVYVADGHEELVRGAQLADLSLKSFKRVLGTSDSEFIYNSGTGMGGNMATYIVPGALLFEELEVTKNSTLNLQTPYIVEKPVGD